VLARRDAGTFILRVEDIDRRRVVRGSQGRIESDLRWLGLDWDEGPFLQSERSALYEGAITTLQSAGLVYPCDCSRAEIASVASAPHLGEEVVYPGFCRGRDPARAMKRPAALRVRVPSEIIAYEDRIVGTVNQNLRQAVGDFVLRRGDGVFAYQLATLVDDLAMGVTDVVRGDDLVSSTPRQIWLARALDARPPRYAHVPLVASSDGSRLEKRTPGSIVRELREAGVSAERIVGELALGLGLMPTAEPATAREVADAWAGREIAWRREPWRIPPTLTRF
jgi:glutamyl-tRNA synthetase